MEPVGDLAGRIFHFVWPLRHSDGRGVGGGFGFTCGGRQTGARPGCCGGAPAGGRRPGAGLWLFGARLGPVTGGLQGWDALDVPFSSWGRWAIWQAAFSTSYGLSATLTGGAWAAALVSLAAGGKLARGLAVAGLLLTGLALAATGHASTASPFWLARSAVWLHAVAIACWLGSLVRSEEHTSELQSLMRLSY